MFFITREMEQLRKSCNTSYKNIDYGDKQQVEEYEYFSKKLLDALDENGELTSKDLNTFFYYFIGKKISQTKFPLPYSIKFTILADEVFMEELKSHHVKLGTKAITISNSRQARIYVKQSVIDKALFRGKLNFDGLDKSLHIASHEFVHAGMAFFIHNANSVPNPDLIRMQKEFIVCLIYEDYKEKNYSGLLGERNADYDASLLVSETLSTYFKKFYTQFADRIAEDIEYYKNLADNPQHKDPRTHYQYSRNAGKLLDELVEDIARNHKFNVHSILGIEYNEHNEKKKFSDLLKDYKLAKQKNLEEHRAGTLSSESYTDNIKDIEEVYDSLIENASGNPEKDNGEINTGSNHKDIINM